MTNIKYRVWDKERRMMCSVARISFGDDGAALTILAEPAPVGEFYRGLVHGESGILMQFTGLKDKNGKEIYEGDIVAVWENGINDEMADKKNYEVEWGGVDYPAFTLDGWENGEMNAFSEISMSGDWEYEVIGNIYENPELIL